MDFKEAARSWEADGFVILPGFIPSDDLKSAVGELDLLFPSSEWSTRPATASCQGCP
jgi:hypothetical protein